MLALKEISKIYENPYSEDFRVLVLKGISRVFNLSHNYFIIGNSGSGKSTLLRLIAGLETPSSGNIIYNDVVINKLKKKELLIFRRKNLGFLFQNPNENLFFNLNVEQNIRFPMLLSGIFSRKTQQNKVTELLDLVGLAGKEKFKINQLSGGERQRIALCSAVSNDPKIIIADEPTGELDSKNANRIIDLLRQIKNLSGCCSIIVTHNLNLISQNEKILYLKNGLLEEINNKPNSYDKSNENQNISKLIIQVNLNEDYSITFPNEFLFFLKTTSFLKIKIIEQNKIILEKINNNIDFIDRIELINNTLYLTPIRTNKVFNEWIGSKLQCEFDFTKNFIIISKIEG
jgi:putative ABC transport system ATP-binding protein